MSIFVGDQEPQAIYLGGSLVSEIYKGDEKIWPIWSDPDPQPEWDFFDDFERASLGADWVGTGAVIHEGTLRKSTSSGTSRNWTNRTFDSDDIEVEVTIGTTMDNQQLGIILIGSGVANDDYVMLEFSKQTMRVRTWTGVFSNVATLPTQTLSDGAVINLRRRGNDFTVTYDGGVIGTFTSAVALGADYRRVALTVNMATNFFVNWYGPTFDDVGVLAH